MSLEQFHEDVHEDSSFQHSFQELCGCTEIKVGEWDMEGGVYPLWGQKMCNPMAVERYGWRRKVTFTTPLNVPTLVKKLLGASSSNVIVAQYLVEDGGCQVRMWSDVELRGVPLADSLWTQFGYTVTRVTVRTAHLELTARSTCSKQLPLGMENAVEQSVHDGQKATHKQWAQFVLKRAETFGGAQTSPPTSFTEKHMSHQNECLITDASVEPCAFPSDGEAVSQEEVEVLSATFVPVDEVLCDSLPDQASETVNNSSMQRFSNCPLISAFNDCDDVLVENGFHETAPQRKPTILSSERVTHESQDGKMSFDTWDDEVDAATSGQWDEYSAALSSKIQNYRVKPDQWKLHSAAAGNNMVRQAAARARICQDSSLIDMGRSLNSRPWMISSWFNPCTSRYP